MKIAYRTGAGRGVYELAGARPEGVDLLNRKIVLGLPSGIQLKTNLRLTDQGGKPRLVRVDQSEIQIQRQIAALLLMPKPTRSTMGRGFPILRAETYQIDSIEVDFNRLLESDSFVLLPHQLFYRNESGEDRLSVPKRFSRITFLWQNNEKFSSQISGLLKRHQSLIMAGEPLGQEAEDIVESLQNGLAETALASGGKFEAFMDPLQALDLVSLSLTTALCTKPLVILTGPSGTGKSKVAIDLATAFDYGDLLPETLKPSQVSPATCMAFVPVGADWTDQRSLLGFRNPFGPKRETAEGGETHLTYEITDTLKLILRALHPNYSNTPHFLILDEMNLSHVERYFSSFLALMEAERSTGGTRRFELIDPENLKLIAAVLEYSGENPMEAQSALELSQQRKGVPFPPNLYVVGTVNVDETTYMFSPKVLDRAFVIEIKAVEPRDYLYRSPSPTQDLIALTKASILFEQAISRNSDKSWNERHPIELFNRMMVAIGIDDAEAKQITDPIALALNGIYKLLNPVGFSFGYRVINEVYHYVIVWLQAQYLMSDGESGFASDWTIALDKAIEAKILPKIHGNRRRLGDSLRALSTFFSGSDTSEVSYTLGTTPIKLAPSDQLNFPLHQSQEKAEQLHQTLQASGYTTFIS